MTDLVPQGIASSVVSKRYIKRLIILDSSEYTVLFTDQIFRNSLSPNIWLSICFKIRGRAFQKPGQAFQTLSRTFEA